MALSKGSGSETEEYHSLSGDEPEDGEDDAESEATEPPVHPVRSMQGAFEESIVDSTNEKEGDAPRASLDANAEVRRQKLLESKQYDDSWIARWKQKPNAKHHPLLKLMAQIVFGMHLLQQQQAKSEEEVVKILQRHVNEVDTFLERSSEDFDLALNDIEERIRFLKLPMVHQDVFEIMLDDKKFRTQLLDGNEKIENIIERTTRAKNASMLDIQQGIEANKELSKYLDRVDEHWPRDKRVISEVFGAMRGNEYGWSRYMKDLQSKGKSLGQYLGNLGTLVGEMSKLAATASRRSKTQSKAVASGQSKSTPSSPGLRSKFSDEPQPPIPPSSSPPRRTSNLNKPLPKEPPEAEAGAARSTAKPHPVPFAERYERPRQSPLSPQLGTSRSIVPPSRNHDPPRPKTAGAGMTPREARAADARNNTADLATFLKSNNPHENPLRSNPPDEVFKPYASTGAEKKLGRSQSQGANLLMNPTPPVENGKAVMARSRSQGALGFLRGADKPLKLPSSDGRDMKSARPSIDKSGPLSRYLCLSRRLSLCSTNRICSTGFARRLSKRMKHLPVPEEPTQEPNTVVIEKADPPPDSAYSSGSDKKLKANEPKTESNTRPESTLGPLPLKRDQPTNSSRLRNDQSLKQDDGMSMRSLASTSKSRTLRIKNIFHWKFRSGKMVAA